MTYVSNWIEIKGRGPNKDPAKPKCLIDKFPPPHDRYGPYVLQDWARTKGLDIEYIDNCWLRVDVTGHQLRNFFEELYAGDLSQIADLLPKIRANSDYVIVAEEF